MGPALLLVAGLARDFWELEKTLLQKNQERGTRENFLHSQVYPNTRHLLVIQYI